MTAGRGRPVLGVLGGMGPQATISFLDAVTRLTPAQRDQDHLTSIVRFEPSIPDRTVAILAGSDAPLAPLRAGLMRLADEGATLLAVPCNTAHYFIDQFLPELPVPLVHIVEATLTAAKPLNTRCWLTGTTGTMRIGLYQRYADVVGLELREPDESLQPLVDEIIGLVKAGEMAEAGFRYRGLTERLLDQEDMPVISACTELPLAYAAAAASNPHVSSIEALARAVVSTICGIDQDSR